MIKTSAIVLALLTAASVANAQTSVGGGNAAGSGSVTSPRSTNSGNGNFGGTEIRRERNQAEAPDKTNPDSNGVDSQDRDTGRDRAHDRMSPQGLEHNRAPAPNPSQTR